MDNAIGNARGNAIGNALHDVTTAVAAVIRLGASLARGAAPARLATARVRLDRVPSYKLGF